MSIAGTPIAARPIASRRRVVASGPPAASAAFTISAATSEATLTGKKLRITLTGATWIT